MSALDKFSFPDCVLLLRKVPIYTELFAVKNSKQKLANGALFRKFNPKTQDLLCGFWFCECLLYL